MRLNWINSSQQSGVLWVCETCKLKLAVVERVAVKPDYCLVGLAFWQLGSVRWRTKDGPSLCTGRCVNRRNWVRVSVVTIFQAQTKSNKVEYGNQSISSNVSHCGFRGIVGFVYLFQQKTHKSEKNLSQKPSNSIADDSHKLVLTLLCYCRIGWCTACTNTEVQED